MKETKFEPSFSFRRSSSGRYSLDKRATAASPEVKLKRASWSAFPLLKLSLPEDKKPDKKFLKSQSTEDIKKRKFSWPGTTIFRPSKSVRNLFTSHSSTVSVDCYSSSTSSNASSPESGRQRNSFPNSMSLIRAEGDVRYSATSASAARTPESNSSSFPEALRQLHIRQRLGNPFEYHHRSSSSTFMDQEDEESIMNTPKIICAHRKTPDLKRRTATQISYELELMRKHENIIEEPENISVIAEEKENVVPRVVTQKSSNPSYKNGKLISKSINKLKSKKNSSIKSETAILARPSKPETSPISHIVQNGATNCSIIKDSHFHLKLINNGVEPSIRKDHFLNLMYGSQENDVLIDGDSDSEVSEIMSGCGDDLYYFENRLEENLENLDEEECEAPDKDVSCRNRQVSFKDVQLRKRNKLDLYLDVETARQHPQREYLLRRIAEEDSDGLSSNRSSPRTPRSPAIDIDDIFEARRKKIDDENRDSMSRVKDLTQRLQLHSVGSLNSPVEPIQLPANETFYSSVVIESEPNNIRETVKTEPTSEERKNNLAKAMQWIREELIAMKQQDQELAQKFIDLQLEMQRLRLLKSCTQHEALLEDVHYGEEEQRAFKTSGISDPPSNLREYFSPVLQKIGVTRLNIANRRFSLR